MSSDDPPIGPLFPGFALTGVTGKLLAADCTLGDVDGASGEADAGVAAAATAGAGAAAVAAAASGSEASVGLAFAGCAL